MLHQLTNDRHFCGSRVTGRRVESLRSLGEPPREVLDPGSALC